MIVTTSLVSVLVFYPSSFIAVFHSSQAVICQANMFRGSSTEQPIPNLTITTKPPQVDPTYRSSTVAQQVRPAKATNG
ncbi:hypothetical protein EDB80DRAFT_723849 [Ilyonectria destructans]|nr:hypothetical protein EDB80DRAFT_723849 [Ilyonectria destructans]